MTITVSQNNFKSLYPYIDNEDICRYDEEFRNLIVIFMFFVTQLYKFKNKKETICQTSTHNAMSLSDPFTIVNLISILF